MSAAIVGTGNRAHDRPVSPDLTTVVADLLAAGGTTHPERTFERLCNGALTVLQASAVAVLLTGESNDDLLSSATSGEPLTRVLLREVAAGPCGQLRSQGSRDPIVIADLRRARRWPAVCSHAVAGGLVSLTVSPLLAEPDGLLGALVVGYDRPGGPTARQVGHVETLAAAAANFQRMNRRLLRAWQVAGQLERALSTRVVVEQAKGFLAGRLGMSPADAFHVLRSYARPRNTKVSDVARRLLDSSLEPTALLRDEQPAATRQIPKGPAKGACA